MLKQHLRRRHSPHGECGLKLTVVQYMFNFGIGHSPHGECGLKLDGVSGIASLCCRHSPHGECGLKCIKKGVSLMAKASLPAWGVWIEIPLLRYPMTRSASLPAWGVWIEIKSDYYDLTPREVTPRMGSVD